MRPDRMLNPGVIFEAGNRDWLAFLEGQRIDTDTGVEPIDPSDYNAPSIAIGELAGTKTVTRKVTAVKAGSYQTTISVPGVAATVKPSILNFTSAGETKTVTITFAAEAALVSETVFGSLKFQWPGTLARLPVAVVPQASAAPAGTG
jgi:Fibronectin type-III domain